MVDESDVKPGDIYAGLNHDQTWYRVKVKDVLEEGQVRKIGHVSWQPLLGLLSWYPVMLWSLCISFEDRAPADEICGCPIFKGVAVTRLKREGTGIDVPVMATRMPCPIRLILLSVFCCSPPVGRLNIKMSSYQYRDPHVKDKTVSPTVLSLTWESPYLGKTVFILRQGPGDLLWMWATCLSYNDKQHD